ncbi:MAG: hypothetical protein JEZ01_18725 [Labilibaculum sp.]|nr:type VI secretion system tube protein TssD [Labilibaculum sp.]MBI9059806.1 hypothetical protein [Labilibaculum sp.]
MSIKGKMYVDDMVYNIRRLDFGFDQKINTNGTASTQPLGGLFNIEVESPKSTHLYAWGASNFDMKYIKLEFSPVTLTSKSRTIELYDTLCIRHHDYFHHDSKDPMISVLQLSPAIIVQDGQTLVEKNWKVSDLSMQNVEPTAVPATSEEPLVGVEDSVVSENEPELMRIEWTDLDEKSIVESEDSNVMAKLSVSNILVNNEVIIKLKHKDSETGDISYSTAKGIVNADGTITLKE